MHIKDVQKQLSWMSLLPELLENKSIVSTALYLRRAMVLLLENN